MAKPNINNYEDLRNEKERLKENLKLSRARISQSFGLLKEELNPFSNIGKVTKNALQANTSNPLIKFGIKRASEFLIGKVLLKRAGWLPRLIVPFAVREVTTRLVGRKAEKKIATTLRNTAAAIRKVEVPDLSQAHISKK